MAGRTEREKKNIESCRLICSWIDHRLFHHLWTHGVEHNTWIERRQFMIYGTLKESRLKEALERALNLNRSTKVSVQIKKAPTPTKVQSA